MTFSIQLKLSFTSSQELLLECSFDDERALAYAPLPKEMSDLVTELSGGKAISSAISLAQRLITETLFHGEVGELLSRVLESTQGHNNASKLLESAAPVTVITLSVPDELHSWPWELATYPGTNQALLLNSVELIRAVGDLPSEQEISSMNLSKSGRVITKASEVFKFSAMRAATSHIARNFSVNVSATHQRNELKRETPLDYRLFNHVYAVDKYGYLTLDTVAGESALTLSASTIAAESVFLNITPPIPCSEVLAARRAGSMVILSRQFEQSVKTRAESDRAIYHALGAGYSFVHALHWARLALHQSEPDRYQWATLTLTTGASTGTPFALSSFPPSFSSSSSIEQTAAAPSDDKGEESFEFSDLAISLSTSRQALPSSASVFVKETVALIQKSQQSGDPNDKEQLALRTPMMRQLSAIVQSRKITPDASLTRSAQLSQQLIEAGYIEDEPLRLPKQWFGRSQRLASALGLKVDPIAQATRALVASPVIWITGLDAYTRALFARGLCEEVFQSFPYEPMIEYQATDILKTTLSDLTELSWSKEDQASQRWRRQMVIGFHQESLSWRRYRRTFGVISQAQGLSAERRETAITALRSHSLIDQTRGCRLPEESRLIFLSEHSPQQDELRGEVVIKLEVDPDQLRHIWHRDLRAYLIAQAQEPSSIEDRLSAPVTEAFTSLLCLALRLNVITPSQGFDALLYSVLTNAAPNMCTESAELYLHPALKENELIRDCIYAFAQRDQDGYEASWMSLYPEKPAPELPVVSIDI